LRLRTIVRRVRWERAGKAGKRGARGAAGTAGVLIECETAAGSPLPPLVARRAIVTLPVGVLRAGDVAFEPELPPAKQRAIQQIEPGPVVKLILKFREPFWESPLPAALGKSLTNLCFLHGPTDAAVPTWWTYFPVRTTVLTGWAGGPAANRLSHRPVREIAGEALDALAAMTGLARDRLDGLLDAFHIADWQADPFSRGAYSYLAVGGTGAPKALAQPLGDALFFAGEATGSEGIGGTVDAAISSGRRAAGEILTAQGRARAADRQRS
jgi:monoamine oxidase